MKKKNYICIIKKKDNIKDTTFNKFTEEKYILKYIKK